MPKAISIFLIDDNTLDTFIAEKILTISGYTNVSIFNNSLDALGELENGTKPDLVFLDLNMPFMDGFKFLAQLEMDRIEVKVIILSSSDNPADRGQAFNYANVIDYFVKPLTESDLKSLEQYAVKLKVNR